MRVYLIAAVALAMVPFLSSTPISAQEQAVKITPNNEVSPNSDHLFVFAIPSKDGKGFAFPADKPSFVEITDSDGNRKKEKLSVSFLRIGEEYTQEVKGVKIRLVPEETKLSSAEKLIRVTLQRAGSREVVYLLTTASVSPGPLSPAAPSAIVSRTTDRQPSLDTPTLVNTETSSEQSTSPLRRLTVPELQIKAQ